MDSPSTHSPDIRDASSDAPPVHARERTIAFVLIGLVLLYALWTLRIEAPSQNPPIATGSNGTVALSPETVPLATGVEPVIDIFTQSGCPVCHTISGIPGANGQVGPRLILGTTGEQRLRSSDYTGNAETVHEYIIESVLDPDRFIVPGYPGHTMPSWYGSKLSALALEKIAVYLEQQTEGEVIR